MEVFVVLIMKLNIKIRFHISLGEMSSKVSLMFLADEQKWDNFGYL